jgi:hypothetical protein
MFALAISTGFIYSHVVALELTIRQLLIKDNADFSLMVIKILATSMMILLATKKILAIIAIMLPDHGGGADLTKGMKECECMYGFFCVFCD